MNVTEATSVAATVADAEAAAALRLAPICLAEFWKFVNEFAAPSSPQFTALFTKESASERCERSDMLTIPFLVHSAMPATMLNISACRYNYILTTYRRVGCLVAKDPNGLGLYGKTEGVRSNLYEGACQPDTYIIDGDGVCWETRVTVNIEKT